MLQSSPSFYHVYNQWGLVDAQLSMMITELGPGNGFICSRSTSMNSVKSAALKEPSTIDANKKPSKDRAGRIEKLSTRVRVRFITKFSSDRTRTAFLV